MPLVRTKFLIAALAVLAAAPVTAVEVYHWVDANGVPHYSQWQPASAEPDVHLLTLEETATAGVGGDVYPVEEQAEAMAALWQALEQDREERRARRRGAQPPAVVNYAQPVAPAVWPLWFGDDHRRPHPQPPRKPPPETPPEDELPESWPYRPPGQQR